MPSAGNRRPKKIRHYRLGQQLEPCATPAQPAGLQVDSKRTFIIAGTTALATGCVLKIVISSNFTEAPSAGRPAGEAWILRAL